MRHLLPRAAGVLLLCSVAATARAADLTVSAASSLAQAFRDLGALYEADNPGTKLRLNFGASGALLQQIAKGAPVDVFASADEETMDRAQAQGLLGAGQRRHFASNVLVVVVPAAGSRGAVPTALSDLARPGFARIAIGLPASVPVGHYTRDVLEAAGLWGAVEPKMIAAHNVRQALDYVARAEVDAGFVYATDAALMPDKVKVALRLATTRPLVYPAAALARAPQPEQARRFVDFLVSAPAQALLARHGFGRP